MGYTIRKAAVIGSGTMGSGIAALLAGIGVQVVLLDISAKDSAPGDRPDKRNSIVLNNFKAAQKSRPAQFFHTNDLDLITVGNLDDDLDLVRDADWIVEVIVENLAIKQSLMEKLERVRKPGAIISTNTSGLSIAAIAEGRSDEFKQHFLGHSLFQPAALPHLIRDYPAPHDRSRRAGLYESTMGRNCWVKGWCCARIHPTLSPTVLSASSGTFGLNYALDHGYTVAEVDSLTGPLIGRPKTASFRLTDLVGTDIMAHVNQNLYPAIPDDESREVLNHPQSAAAYNMLEQRNAGQQKRRRILQAGRYPRRQRILGDQPANDGA